MKTSLLKVLQVAPLCLISCHGALRSDPGDEELLNLKPLQTLTFQKTSADESWNNDTRLAYAGYYYLLGEYLGLEGNLSESENLLELANELDPNEFLAFKVVAAKISVGKDLEAKNELQKLILIYPQSAQFRAIYAVLLAKFGEMDSAIAQLEESIALAPSEERAYLHLIAIYQQLHKTDSAIKITKRLCKEIPRSSQGRLLLAHLYHQKGNKKAALQSAKQAYQLNPNHTESTLFYAQLLEHFGDKEGAITLYDQLFSENPSLEELLSKTMALYKTFGDLNAIYKRLEAMSAHTQKKSIGIEIQKALVLWEQSKNREALDVLLSLHSIYPNSEQILYLCGLAYEKIEDTTKALTLYEQVKEDSSFFIASHFQALRVLEAQKRFQEAYKIIHKLTESRYRVSEVYSVGAGLYVKEEKYQDAINLLNEGTKKFPEDVQLIFLTGVFQEKIGKIEDCINSMRTVLHKDPNYSSALNYLGYIWAERGIKLDLAQSLIERALSIKPNDGFYLDSLGWVYYQKGDFHKALEIIMNASRSEPDEGVIVEHLGDVYLKMGKKEEAIQTYEQALKKPNLESKDRARIQLKVDTLQNKKEA